MRGFGPGIVQLTESATENTDFTEANRHYPLRPL
jgi:hypothetical protein